MQHVHMLLNKSACILYINEGIDTGFHSTPPDPINSSVINRVGVQRRCSAIKRSPLHRHEQKPDESFLPQTHVNEALCPPNDTDDEIDTKISLQGVSMPV